MLPDKRVGKKKCKHSYEGIRLLPPVVEQIEEDDARSMPIILTFARWLKVNRVHLLIYQMMILLMRLRLMKALRIN